MERELPKRPDLPANFMELVDDITKLCFVPSKNETVDVVFVFGNWSQKSQKPLHIEQLYRNNISKYFVLTGGKPTHDYSHLGSTAVADDVYAGLAEDIIENSIIHIQNRSINSVEDIELSMPFMANINKSTIGCVACNWAMGRQMMYLKKFFPTSDIYPLPYDTRLEDGSFLTASNWHHNTDGQKRLWGEIIRMKLYGERGDMAYPDDLRHKVDTVFSKIKP